MENIKKYFNYLYIVFSFLVIVSTFTNTVVIRVMAFFVSLLILFFSNKIKGPWFTYLLIFVGIVLRIGLIFIPNLAPISDYGSFYDRATEFSKDFYLNSKFTATFPYLINYIVLLGTIFKLFGNKYIVVIISNIIFDLIGAFFLFLIFKDKKIGALWLINPLNIIWCYMVHPIAITNMMFIISIYILIIFLNNKKIIYALLLGFILSTTNLFRPVLPIMVIAILIYLIYKKEKIMLMLSIVLSFICFNNVYSIINQKYVSYKFSKNSTGWSMYLGSNTKYNGRWNQEQNREFQSISNANESPEFIQKIFRDKAIEQYRDNGFKNINLVVNKLMILTKETDYLTTYTFFQATKEQENDSKINIINFFTSLFYYILIVSSFIYSIKFKDNYILKLFTIGLITGHFLLEVSGRYAICLMVPYTIFLYLYDKRKKIE